MPRSAADLDQFGRDEGEICSLLRVLAERDFHVSETMIVVSVHRG